MRCRPEYEAAIYEDLGWLGISWVEPVRRQSEHFDDYSAALAKLERQGLIYPSFESRSEIDGAGRRARPARPLAARSRRRAALSRPGAQTAARRARAPPRGRRAVRAAARHGRGGGARRRADLDRDRQRAAGPDRRRHRGAADVGRRRAGAARRCRTSYHLAVVVDDALQGVTDVVRGQDLFWSTSIHRLLQALLGLPEPVYHHHRLILDAAGRKLSKSSQAKSLRELRADGATAARHQAHGRARTLTVRGACNPSGFRPRSCGIDCIRLFCAV